MRPKDPVDPLKQDGVVYKTVTIGFSTECLKQRNVSIGPKFCLHWPGQIA